MKSLSKYMLPAILIIATSYSATAQNAVEIGIGYNVGLPASSFKNDYISKPSFRGFAASLDYAFTSQWRAGISIGFNDYYQKYPRQVYNEGGGSAVSAVLSNSIQLLPVMAHVNYTLFDKGLVRPYAGLGAGANFIHFDQYLGEFDNPVSKVKFIVQGEAGVFIPLSSYSSTAIKIGAAYNFSPFNEFGTPNLNSWGLQAGIRFPLH
ncbi:MAG: outer membrane beta-barrel protein [Bacteroidetes bacterium]|nr:outer membrane beta-barrel protein [Bacteroidota bacterium]MBS1974060.1 outer membrane beta-barrel protein [Bacteroidota bacterium]